MRLGGLVLIANLDGVIEPDVPKRLVPVEDALADPSPIADGNGVLDIKNDRLLGRTEAELGIALLEVPAIDVAGPLLVRLVLTKIAVDGREVPDALIRGPRLVAGAVGDNADGVVEGGKCAAGNGNFNGNLDVLWKRLGADDSRQAGVDAANSPAEKRARLADEQIIEVDHGLTAGTHRHDRHIHEHAVGEQALHGALGLRLAGGPSSDLRFNQRHALVVALPIDVAGWALQAGEDTSAGLGHGDEVSLAAPPGRQLGQELVLLLVEVDRIQRLRAIRGGDDLLEPFGHFGEFREVGLLLVVGRLTLPQDACGERGDAGN